MANVKDQVVFNFQFSQKLQNAQISRINSLSKNRYFQSSSHPSKKTKNIQSYNSKNIKKQQCKNTSGQDLQSQPEKIEMIPKIFIFFCIIFFSISAPVEQQVHLAIPYTGHKWYSGYLNFTHGAFHYVFFDSQRDPDNDPVVLWLNGGPGCSSLIGMVYENGPFVFLPNDTNFQMNQYAWNKKANLLYIQSPQGVGFSVGNPERLDDGTVAQYNLKALLNFFIKFPNLKKNDFYMTGESYAGIYIPYLANEILKHNRLPSSKQTIIKLKGIMIGNACTDPDQCYTPGDDGFSIYQYQFLYKHAYMTERDYDHMRASCLLGYNSPQCVALRKILDKNFQDTRTSILNIYLPCYSSKLNQSQPSLSSSFPSSRKLRQSGRYSPAPLGDEIDCDDNLGIMHFFNQPLMFEHLHVNPIHYQQCSSSVQSRYKMFPNASLWLYPTLIKQMRVWIYSGDVDADVPITGTLHWIQRLREEQGLPIIEPWREWWVPGLHKHEDQVGGMQWRLKNFTFVSVKGAGHMVPKDKRREAQVLLDGFLSGKPLPEKSQ